MASRARTSDHFACSADISTNHNQPSLADHSATYTNKSNSKKEDTSINSTELVENTAPLHVHVERAVRDYFTALGDEVPTDLYELILMQVELPLLTVVLEKTRGNQTKCAQILGLNRGTLRKKLKTYNLMS